MVSPGAGLGGGASGGRGRGPGRMAANQIAHVGKSEIGEHPGPGLTGVTLVAVNQDRSAAVGVQQQLVLVVAG